MTNPNNDRRKMTQARILRNEAAYLLSISPERYKEMADKRIAEAERLEGQVYAILKGEGD